MKKTWKDPETLGLERQEEGTWSAAAVGGLWLRFLCEMLAFGHRSCVFWRTLAGATGWKEATQGWGNPISL